MLILASGSPRRRELLTLMTTDFSVILKEVDESLPAHIHPEEAVRQLARRKAEAVAAEHPADIIIGADTLVFCEGQILGKPDSPAGARNMLRLLSGKGHSVYTGVCLLSPGGQRLFAEESQVFFHELTDDEIDWYIATGEPMDKAGAYGIQGRAAVFVRRIEGDYNNIVGLPVSKLYQNLRTLTDIFKI